MKRSRFFNIRIYRLIAIIIIHAVVLSPAAVGYTQPQHRAQLFLSPRLSINRELFKEAYQNVRTQPYQPYDDMYGLDPEEQRIRREKLKKTIVGYYRQRIKSLPKAERTSKAANLKFLKIVLAVIEDHYKRAVFDDGKLHVNHALDVAEFCARDEGSLAQICAALMHRLPPDKIWAFWHEAEQKFQEKHEKRKKVKHRISFDKTLQRVEFLVESLSTIVDKARYRIHSQGAHAIKNYMGFVSNIMKGDPELRGLVFADYEASIVHASESEREEFVGEVFEIIAPLAYRFGLLRKKNELENKCFFIHDGQRHDFMREQIREVFNREYEELGPYFADVVDLFRSMIEMRFREEVLKGPTAQDMQEEDLFEVAWRIKSLFRISEKEKRLERLRMQKKEDVEGVGEDIMGMKILVNEREDFFAVFGFILEALGKGQLSDWKIKKDSKGKPKISWKRRFRDREGKMLDIVYLDIVNTKNEKVVFELQLLTKESDRIREEIYQHWAYALSQQTRGKQRFDSVEGFYAYGVYRDLAEQGLGDKEFQEIMDDYFRYIFMEEESVRDWVYVFEKAEEDGRDVVKPKRLKKGANGFVFAAQRGINKLDSSFSGIEFYEWKGDKLVPLPKDRQPDPLAPLKDGAILAVKSEVRANVFADRLKGDTQYKSRVTASVRDFPRANLLIKRIVITDKIRRGYADLGKRRLAEAFHEEGVTLAVDKSGTPLLPYKKPRYLTQFLDEFAQEEGLLNREELYFAVGLEVFEAEDVVEWARLNGKHILGGKYDLDDEVIIEQLEGVFGPKEKLFVKLGLGKEKLSSVQRIMDSIYVEVSASPGQAAPRKKTRLYKLTVGLTKRKDMSKDDISRVVNESEKFIKKVIKEKIGKVNKPDEVKLKVKHGKKKIAIMFDVHVPLNVQFAGELKDALGKIKAVKITVKEKPREPITLLEKRIIIPVPRGRAWDEILGKIFDCKKVSQVGNFHFNESKNALSCVVHVDAAIPNYALRKNLSTDLGISPKRIKISQPQAAGIPAAVTVQKPRHFSAAIETSI